MEWSVSTACLSALRRPTVLVTGAAQVRGGQEVETWQSMVEIGGAATSVTISFDKLFTGNPNFNIIAILN